MGTSHGLKNMDLQQVFWTVWPIDHFHQNRTCKNQPTNNNKQQKTPQIPGLHPTPTATNHLLVKPRNCHFNKLSRRF